MIVSTAAWSVSRLDRSMSRVFEVVAAFVGLDGSDEAADMAANVVDRALLGGAHPSLDPAEVLFDPRVYCRPPERLSRIC
ncbi:hypothetical protein ACVINW_004117 [Bradyrhizobium sp. USDA 4461]